MSLSKKDLIISFVCIAFLLAALGSVGSTGRRRAKEALCLSNLRRWGNVFLAFAEDNDGYFMAGRHPDSSKSNNWWRALEPYYGDRNLLRCPEGNNEYLKAWTGGGNHGVWGPQWFPPGPPEGDGPWWGSYGINEWVCNPPADPGVYRPEKYWRTPNVAGAETIPLLLDSWWDQGWAEYHDTIPSFPGQWEGIGMDDMGHFCIIRHYGAINGVFLDGSAHRIELKCLWSLNWHRGYPVDADEPEWPQWIQELPECNLQ